MRRSALALWINSPISGRVQKTWMVIRGTVCSPSAASALASMSAIGLGAAACSTVSSGPTARGPAGGANGSSAAASGAGPNGSCGVAKSFSPSKSMSNGSALSAGLAVIGLLSGTRDRAVGLGVLGGRGDRALTVLVEHVFAPHGIGGRQRARMQEVFGIGDLRGHVGGDRTAELAVALVGVGLGDVFPGAAALGTGGGVAH